MQINITIDTSNIDENFDDLTYYIRNKLSEELYKTIADYLKFMTDITDPIDKNKTEEAAGLITEILDLVAEDLNTKSYENVRDILYQRIEEVLQ